MALAGERVICVARPETAAAIAAEGLTLVTDDGEHTEQLEVTERLEEPVDLLLVTVKAYGLDDGISRIRTEPGLVLPLLNGLEHMDVLRAHFANVVAAAIGHFEGYRESPTRIVQQTPGACERRRYRGSGAAGTGRHRHAGRRKREGCAVGEARPPGSDRRADVGGW